MSNELPPYDEQAEIAALRQLVGWMSPWIDDQILYHGAVLTDAEADAYNRALGESP